LVLLASGVFSSVCACLTVSQFPKRTPLDAASFTRVMPLASSGASSQLAHRCYAIPPPRVLHPYPMARFDATHPRRKPYA
jgi:hypothetical protein